MGVAVLDDVKDEMNSFEPLLVPSSLPTFWSARQRNNSEQSEQFCRVMNEGATRRRLRPFWCLPIMNHQWLDRFVCWPEKHVLLAFKYMQDEAKHGIHMRSTALLVYRRYYTICMSDTTKRMSKLHEDSSQR